MGLPRVRFLGVGIVHTQLTRESIFGRFREGMISLLNHRVARCQVSRLGTTRVQWAVVVYALNYSHQTTYIRGSFACNAHTDTEWKNARDIIRQNPCTSLPCSRKPLYKNTTVLTPNITHTYISLYMLHTNTIHMHTSYLYIQLYIRKDGLWVVAGHPTICLQFKHLVCYTIILHTLIVSFSYTYNVCICTD